MPSELDPVAPPSPGQSPGFGGPGSPAPAGFGGPGILKPDKTVVGAYRADDGTMVSIAGVCKFTEDGFDCWRMDGTPDKELAATLKKGITEHSPSYDFNLRLNRKNRLVVARVQQEVSTRDSVMVVGAGVPLGYVGMPLSLPGENPRGPKLPWAHYEIRSVAEDRAAKTTVLRLTEITVIDPHGVLIPCAEKEEGSVADEAYQVATIRKGEDPQRPQAHRTMWTIRVERTKLGQGHLQIAVLPCDQAGRQITYVDSNGAPVSAEVYQRAMAELRALRRSQIDPNAPRYGLADIRSTYLEGVVEITTNIDPSKIGRLKLVGRYAKRVDLTGIPLDPK